MKITQCFSGLSTDLYKFSLSEILPSTMTYLTYEGSLTQPGCQETVTWVILNKPLYISTYQVIHCMFLVGFLWVHFDFCLIHCI